MRLQCSDLSPDGSSFTRSLSSYIRGSPVSGPWIKGQPPLSPDIGPGSGLRRSSLIFPQRVTLSLAPAPTCFLRVSLATGIGSERRSLRRAHAPKQLPQGYLRPQS